MKQLAAALALMLAATSAQAWGAREQGMLIGVAGTLLFQHVARAQQPQQPEVVVGGQVQTPQGTVYGRVTTVPQRPGGVVIEQPTIVYGQGGWYPAQPICRQVPVYDVYGRWVAQQTQCRY
jgi:DMSO/TMAO reductase YedYZ molybdopterin-dependent catalytic subunit